MKKLFKHLNPFARSEPGKKPGKRELLLQILARLGELMSAISTYAERVNAKFDVISTSLDGIQGDVNFLKAKIEELQSSAGAITPEDQALLDAIEARVGALSDRVGALDAATETPPPAPTP